MFDQLASVYSHDRIQQIFLVNGAHQARMKYNAIFFWRYEKISQPFEQIKFVACRWLTANTENISQRFPGYLISLLQVG